MEGSVVEKDTPVKASVLIGTESSEDGCTIKFDIRIRMPLPDKAITELNKKIKTYKIILNVEMQRSANTKYNLGKRGIYYVARSISTQIDKVDENTDYDQVQPVHSIWIVINRIPKHLQNKVIHYKMVNYTKQQNSEYVKADKRSNKIDTLDAGVDMVHLHYIFLNNIKDLNNELNLLYPPEKSENYTDSESVLEFLTLLFTNSLKDDRMNKYLDDNTRNRSMEGVDSMTAAIRELEKEREEGIERGIVLGDLRTLQKKILKGKDYATIFNEMEIEDEDYFESLYLLIQEYPDYSVEELLEMYFEN